MAHVDISPSGSGENLPKGKADHSSFSYLTVQDYFLNFKTMNSHKIALCPSIRCIGLLKQSQNQPGKSQTYIHHENRGEKQMANMNLPPRMNMVTALEFAQCSIYSIRSFVVPKDFSLTKPA